MMCNGPRKKSFEQCAPGAVRESKTCASRGTITILRAEEIKMSKIEASRKAHIVMRDTAGSARDADGDAMTTSQTSSGAGSPKEEAAEDPEKHADRLEEEIEGIRDNLDGLVTELDHRRHGLNPRVMLKRHPWSVAIGGAVLVGLVVGGVAWRNLRAREGDSFKSRAKRWRQALRRAEDKPEKVAEGQPNVGMKILTAAATAAAAVVARRLATRFFARSS
jgi:hypothetical protein